MPIHIRPFLTLPLALITLLVLLSSGPAYAGWEEVGKTNKATIYIDPDTIRNKEDKVKMWVLYDYKTEQTSSSGPYLSIRGQGQYDCTEELARILASTRWSGNMANGTGFSINSDEEKWEPVAPQTVNQILWQRACNKQ